MEWPCRDDLEGVDEDDPFDDYYDAWECIGKECLHPSFNHMRSECYTAKDCEQRLPHDQQSCPEKESNEAT